MRVCVLVSVIKSFLSLFEPALSSIVTRSQKFVPRLERNNADATIRHPYLGKSIANRVQISAMRKAAMSF